jgi:hypothetical protein
LISDTRRERLENARLILNAPAALPVAAQKAVADPVRPSREPALSRLWPVRNRALRWAAAAAVLVIAFGVLMAIYLNLDRSATGGPDIARFELRAGVVRGGDGRQELILPRGVKEVELKLYLPAGNYTRYRAELEKTATGTEWVGEGLVAQAAAAGKVITITLPENLLPAGNYLLTLSGEAEGKGADILAEYQFKVER